MVFCKKCGTEIREGIKFCPKCGTRTSLESDVQAASSVPAQNIEPQRKARKLPLSIQAPVAIVKDRKNYGKIAIGVAVIAIIVIASVFLFMPTKNNVEITVDGSGSVYGSGSYDPGDLVTISAEPSYGYSFSHWMKDGSKVSSNRTYTFTADSGAKFVAVFEPLAFAIQTDSNLPGGTYSSGGTYPYDSNVVLTASAYEGYEFLGWYKGSTPVSTSSKCNIKVESDATYIAKFGIIHDASFIFDASASTAPATLSIDPKYKVEYASRSVTFTDAITGATLHKFNGVSDSTVSFNIKKPTAVKVEQKITYTDGQIATYSDVYVVDGNVTHRYTWYFYKGSGNPSTNNASEAFTWDLSFKWYYKYLTDPIPRDMNEGARERIDDFVTSDDSWIVTLAKYLKERSSGMSDIQRVNCVLKFVQSFDYQFDDVGRKVEDYWKYPAEMLWDQKGDCEDHAILFASLMEAMGYDAVLFYVYCYDTRGNFTDAHMAAGISVAGASGTYYMYDDKAYYYCEATADSGSSYSNWANVGYIPEGYEVQQIFQVS